MCLMFVRKDVACLCFERQDVIQSSYNERAEFFFVSHVVYALVIFTFRVAVWTMINIDPKASVC